MGDRANVLVTDGESRVYLYTHWAGTELPGVVRDALARRERWNDGPYLTRIIFGQMVGTADVMGETGYGISSVVGDGDNRIIVVDVDNQSVKIRISDMDVLSMTFDDFVNPINVPSWYDEEEDAS